MHRAVRGSNGWKSDTNRSEVVWSNVVWINFLKLVTVRKLMFSLNSKNWILLPSSFIIMLEGKVMWLMFQVGDIPSITSNHTRWADLFQLCINLWVRTECETWKLGPFTSHVTLRQPLHLSEVCFLYKGCEDFRKKNSTSQRCLRVKRINSLEMHWSTRLRRANKGQSTNLFHPKIDLKSPKWKQKFYLKILSELENGKIFVIKIKIWKNFFKVKVRSDYEKQ